MIQLTEAFHKVFNFSGRPLTEADSPETVPGWDSFQSLILFQELEEQARVSFRVEDLAGIKTVADLCRLCEKYGIAYRL